MSTRISSMKTRLTFPNLFIFLLALKFSISQTVDGETMAKTFLYFAYGSNLLEERIHINNPSAVRIDSGILRDYRLDFNLYSKRWKGASATVVPTKNQTVWGAIWEIDSVHTASLDRQEGVHENIYFVFNANIETLDGKTLTCRCYQQTDTPPMLQEGETLPEDRKPSWVYLDTIIRGAAESNLPMYYQYNLKAIPHNDYRGDVDHAAT